MDGSCHQSSVSHQESCYLTEESASTHLLWVRRRSSQDFIPTNTKTATAPSGQDADRHVFIRTCADMTNSITRKAARVRARSFCWPIGIRDCDRLEVSSKYVRVTIVRNSYAAALAQCKPPHWIFIAVMESHTEHVVSYVFLHPGSWTEGITIVMPSLNANFHHHNKLKWNNGSQWSPSLTVTWFNGTKQWIFMLK